MKLVKLDDDVWVNPKYVVMVERAFRPDGTDVGARVELRGLRVRWVSLDVYEVLDRLDPPVLGVGPTPPPVVKFDPEWM